MAGRCVIGVDLGGTNVRAQALWEDGSDAGVRIEQPSRAQEGREAVIASVAEAVGKAAESAQAEPLAVGLAIPGHVDDDAGSIRWSPNFGEEIDGVFHPWRNVPVKDDLVSLVGRPIVMGNDANCAALGEYMFGSGKGKANCLVMLTLGTGVGGGVVMSPRSLMGQASGPLLLIGGNKGGAELGHILLLRGGLDCNAGSYGALEAYCQRDSIVTRALHKVRRKPDSMIFDLVQGDLSKVTPKVVAEAANAGDFQAQDVLRDVGEWLGAGIGSLINVFAPDVFAIGGQIAKAGRYLLEPAINEARYVAIPSLFEDCRIGVADQQDDAGLLGGAALAINSLNVRKD
jgi:glucokinase